MTLVQYGDYFYLYVLIIALIPAIILGLLEKNIKYYYVTIDDLRYDSGERNTGNSYKKE